MGFFSYLGVRFDSDLVAVCDSGFCIYFGGRLDVCDQLDFGVRVMLHLVCYCVV